MCHYTSTPLGKAILTTWQPQGVSYEVTFLPPVVELLVGWWSYAGHYCSNDPTLLPQVLSGS